MGRWTVKIKKKAEKSSKKLSKKINDLLAALIKEIEIAGPVRGNWSNYSKLGKGKHHCHLDRKHVACWEETEKGITVEVYYVGSRENAPYD